MTRNYNWILVLFFRVIKSDTRIISHLFCKVSALSTYLSPANIELRRTLNTEHEEFNIYIIYGVLKAYTQNTFSS